MYCTCTVVIIVFTVMQMHFFIIVKTETTMLSLFEYCFDYVSKKTNDNYYNEIVMYTIICTCMICFTTIKIIVVMATNPAPCCCREA